MANHDHKFTELKLFKIIKVHNQYRGTAGDKAFITKKCSCGKVSPLDYGPTKDMQAKLAELEKEHADSI